MKQRVFNWLLSIITVLCCESCDTVLEVTRVPDKDIIVKDSQLKTQSSNAKPLREACDLAFATINNPVIDTRGDIFYVGKTFVDFDSIKASVSCILTNFGNAPFISDPLKNHNFIHIKVGHVDTVKMEIVSVWEYYKSDFEPYGSCVKDSVCGPNSSGVIAINSFDQYDETYDSMKLGYNIAMLELNTEQQYDELDYKNDDYCFGFYWVKTGWTEPSQGMWNGLLDDKFLTKQLIKKRGIFNNRFLTHQLVEQLRSWNSIIK